MADKPFTRPRMRRMSSLRFSLAALVLLASLLCACTFVPYKIAILDFESNSRLGEDQYLTTAVPEFLFATLGNERICKLFERQDMRTHLLNFKNDTTREGKWNRLKQFGESIGADYLVVGSVSRLEDSFILEARLFSVPEGTIIPGTAVWQSCATAREIFDKSRYIAKVLAYQLAQQ